MSLRSISLNRAIGGCILGTAVGDALGLPYEGLSRHRQVRLFRERDRHHFLGNKGMISDDTEHTVIVAQSLIVSAGNPDIFIQSLAKRLRWWLLGCPAGIGLATLRSICKLWLGFSPHNSGVNSAGNGAAMRSALIGVCYGQDLNLTLELVRISTHITHRDRRAELGALAIAIAAHLATRDRDIAAAEYYQYLSQVLPEDARDLLVLIAAVTDSIDRAESTSDFANSLGWDQGISGYIYQTVPIAIHAWLSHPQDYRSAVLTAISCGGDTDTVGAIVGALVGAKVGKQGIPSDWLENIWEFPLTVSWMEKLASRLAIVVENQIAQPPVAVACYWIYPRNFLFLVIVLLHWCRRCLVFTR